MWTGVALCVAGAAGLLVGGLVDVGAADPWASVAGGAAGLVGLAISLYALIGRPAGAEASGAVSASGERSVAAGGNIGTAVTGDHSSATAPPDSDSGV